MEFEHEPVGDRLQIGNGGGRSPRKASRQIDSCLWSGGHRGVETDAATGFSVVEVVPFKQNIKNIEVLLITDDAGSSPTKGGLLNLTAQDVLDITDANHQLFVSGNPGDVVNLGTGKSVWNDNGGQSMPKGSIPTVRRLTVSI